MKQPGVVPGRERIRVLVVILGNVRMAYRDGLRHAS